MKILTIGAMMLVQKLRDQGHQVMALNQYCQDRSPLEPEIDFFKAPETVRANVLEWVNRFQPDWILQIDDSSPIIHVGLEDIRIPKAWYAVDSHLHGDWHRHYAAIFDLVFCAQKNQLENLSQYQGRVQWLPPYFSKEPIFLPWAERQFQASFVGTMDPTLNPERCAFMDALRERGVDLTLRLGDFYPVYSRSKIVINQSVNDDFNFRCLEAMGCGSVLITDRISHSLSDLGTEGVDFLVYERGDVAGLMEKIAWVANHPKDAEEMARRGMEVVKARHLEIHSVQTVIAAFKNFVSRGDASAARSHLACVFEHAARLELPGPVAQHFSQEARRLAQGVLAVSPADPWACLVMARLCFDAHSSPEALEYLRRIETVPIDPIFRKPYFFFKALSLSHCGKAMEAMQTLTLGISEFPDEPNFQKVMQILGR